MAKEALRRIRTLYAIKAEIRGRPAELWQAIRQEQVSGKSALAEAVRYALRHWAGLVLFLGDGRLELDNNTVGRTIRPIALGYRYAPFASSDGGARH